MADFTTRFNDLVNSFSGNDTELADALGVSKQTISAWKNGIRNPKRPVIRTIAEYFGVSIPWLMGLSDDRHDTYVRPLPSNLRPLSDLHRQRVPLIGKVAAGEPIMAETDYEAFVDTPVQCDAALEVQGDSMTPIYLDGDIVYIKHRPDVLDGQIAVVLLDDSATLKYVYHDPNGLTLLSENRAYKPIIAHGDEYTYIAIYGIPVGYTRMYKPDFTKKIKKGF